MRIPRVLSTLLVIALPAAVWAQTPASDPSQPSPQAAVQPASEVGTGMIGTGSVDFGVRGTSISGDSARYNRYRDLGNGLFLQGFRLERTQNDWMVKGSAANVGRADQEFEGQVTRPGTLKAWVSYNQTPWLLSNTTQTLYRSVDPNVLRIDDGLQSSLQAATTAQRPGILSSFIGSNAQTFDLANRRHTGEAGVQYIFDPDTTLTFDVSRMNRTGTIPIAGTFGFSNAVEIAAPVNHHLTDANVTAERSTGRLLVRVGYSGSFFRNDFTSVTWDNPYQRTDTTTLPSQGRESLPPSNDYHDVNGLVAVTMPRHSRLMGSVSFGVLRNVNADILPQTINSAIATAPLERTTVDGNAHTKAANLTFTSTPNRDLSLEVRYRYFDYNNLTPVFTKTQSVQYDSSFSTATLETARYGGSRNNFDASVSLHNVVKDSTIRAGFGRAGANYEERIFASSAETSEFISFDRLTSQWFTLHTKYLHASRRGNGLDTSEIVGDGEQPGIRTFDIADRDRNLVTLVGSFMPTASGNVSVDLTLGTGKDNFPNTQYGVVNAKHYVYGIGVSATPVDKVTFGVSYDLDNYQNLQASHNTSSDPASAAGKLQFVDPTRDWSLTGRDRLNSVLGNIEVTKLADDKLDVRFTYNYNRGRTTYLYGVPANSTLTAPKQLPAVVNDLNRATFDTTYMVTKKVGLGLTYWYERYRVSDFALDATGIPQINMPSTLLLGYQFLPYTASTFFGHLVYHW